MLLAEAWQRRSGEARDKGATSVVVNFDLRTTTMLAAGLKTAFDLGTALPLAGCTWPRSDALMVEIISFFLWKKAGFLKSAGERVKCVGENASSTDEG